ncbi:hypothetical protein COOONC_05921, partial [Cooperia oncophora]
LTRSSRHICGLLFFFVFSAIAAGFRGGSFEYAYSRINRAIRHDLFTGLIRQDVAFFDAHKTGEIASRLAADCQTMSDTVAMNVNVFLRNTVMLMGSMIFMMTLSWRLSLITFILVPIIFVASKIFGSYYDVRFTGFKLQLYERVFVSRNTFLHFPVQGYF